MLPHLGGTCEVQATVLYQNSQQQYQLKVLHLLSYCEYFFIFLYYNPTITLTKQRKRRKKALISSKSLIFYAL